MAACHHPLSFHRNGAGSVPASAGTPEP
jgi:hypothetical protein